MSEVRLRFAPSPTGYLHIGGLRTALYNHLFAKRNNGKFILRIEDTDQTRFVEGAMENLIKSLEWSGISYDEGVFLEDGKIVQKGEYGPYIQSERLGTYKQYVDQLIESGKAYYCFCSKERLDSVREHQKSIGKMPKYDGFCRNIPLEEAKKRVADGEEYVVRLKLPANTDIKFNDLVRGEITINSDDSDDQVLLKSDGFPTYHMAVVVDDHLMKITHVVRGEEWLSSTPKHVYLYDALGWEKPTYVHLPTVLNKERQKLSKRHGDVAVEDFAKQGYLPEALVNYLALVGWSPDSNEEILSLQDMEEQFSFDRVAKNGGIFDRDKLDWVNAQYIKTEPIDRITKLAEPYLLESNLVDEEFINENEEWLTEAIDLVRESVHRLEEFPEKLEFLFGNEIKLGEEELEVLKTDSILDVINHIEFEVNQVDEVDMELAQGLMKKVQKATGVKGKNLFMPSRVALTGSVHGPEFASILYLLGKENILERLEYIKETYL